MRLCSFTESLEGEFMTKGKKTHMHKLRECIYKLRLNHSLRKINKELGIYRPILRNREVALLKGWLEPNSCGDYPLPPWQTGLP